MKGFKSLLVKETLGGYVYFMAYEATVKALCYKKYIYRRFAEFQDFLIGGAAAGLCYWAIVYFLDKLKTLLQTLNI